MCRRSQRGNPTKGFDCASGVTQAESDGSSVRENPDGSYTKASHADNTAASPKFADRAATSSERSGIHSRAAEGESEGGGAAPLRTGSQIRMKIFRFCIQ